MAAESFSSPQDGKRFSAILERSLQSVYTAELKFSGSTPSLENVCRLIGHVGDACPTGWSPDGKHVVFGTIESDRSSETKPTSIWSNSIQSPPRGIT
jgi:Tol biopolymer transport system component